MKKMRGKPATLLVADLQDRLTKRIRIRCDMDGLRVRPPSSQHYVSQAKLASVIGISCASLSRMLDGSQRMPVPIFDKLLTALGISVDMLLQEGELAPPTPTVVRDEAAKFLYRMETNVAAVVGIHRSAVGKQVKDGTVAIFGGILADIDRLRMLYGIENPGLVDDGEVPPVVPEPVVIPSEKET